MTDEFVLLNVGYNLLWFILQILFKPHANPFLINIFIINLYTIIVKLLLLTIITIINWENVYF